MAMYINKEFNILLDLPRGWDVVDDKEVLMSKFGMSEQKAKTTPFSVYQHKDGKLQLISVYSDKENRYSTLWEYFDEVHRRVESVQNDEVKFVSSTKAVSKSNNPIYRAIFSQKQGLTSLYYTYFGGHLFRFSFSIAHPGDDDDQAIMQMIFSIKQPTEIDYLYNDANGMF